MQPPANLNLVATSDCNFRSSPHLIVFGFVFPGDGGAADNGFCGGGGDGPAATSYESQQTLIWGFCGGRNRGDGGVLVDVKSRSGSVGAEIKICCSQFTSGDDDG
ncbi:hypothetical protein L1987_47485 [Smallanthus sonchifolius]|uniref:Uncharacterized protein n=1 Tax=Smallanthus sonchifolius TaxID=185202 RepID=A0ACB9G224_9ASTR|nr:hypothetical protein L1987_47485 [Smallanthus sonchifolius]